VGVDQQCVEYLSLVQPGTIISRDVTRLGLRGASPPAPKGRRSPSNWNGNRSFLVLHGCFGHHAAVTCRLIEDYLFVVFCVVDMIVISLSITCNQ